MTAGCDGGSWGGSDLGASPKSVRWFSVSCLAFVCMCVYSLRYLGKQALRCIIGVSALANKDLCQTESTATVSGLTVQGSGLGSVTACSLRCVTNPTAIAGGQP